MFGHFLNKTTNNSLRFGSGEAELVRIFLNVLLQLEKDFQIRIIKTSIGNVIVITDQEYLWTLNLLIDFMVKIITLITLIKISQNY